MADVIRKKYHSRDVRWLEFLSEGRRKKVADKREILHGSRMELDLLELRDFCDKREIVRKMSRFDADFANDIEGVEKLRNQIAHAGTFNARIFSFRIDVASPLQI
jgi:hypothetical protein